MLTQLPNLWLVSAAYAALIAVICVIVALSRPRWPVWPLALVCGLIGPIASVCATYVLTNNPDIDSFSWLMISVWGGNALMATALIGFLGATILFWLKWAIERARAGR